MMRRILILAIAAAAVLSVAGIGFAVTYSGTALTTSTIEYDGYRINILNDDESQISGALTFDGPDYTAPPAGPGENTRTYTITASETHIDDCKLSLNKDMNVSAMIVMDDDRSWWLIDSITVRVYSDANRTQLKGSYVWEPTSAAASNESWASWTDTGDVVWTQGVQSIDLISTDANALIVTIVYRTDSITISTSENSDDPDLLFDMGGKIVFMGRAPSS